MASARSRRALALIGVACLVWYAAFIARSSYVAVDGRRYFCLFDDAMISMRYAWNFAHGRGLVWNAGGRVEGYTNFLWTLVMSAATWALPRRLASLPLQLAGVALLFAIALVNRAIARRLAPDDDVVAGGAFVAALLYYPLVYWTLMGMETGLLSLLFLVAIHAALREADAPSATVTAALGLAVLTRPDAVLVAAMVLGYRWWRSCGARGAWVEAAIVALVVAAHGVFELRYYGRLVPNTYVLKMTGMPALARIGNGAGYSLLFLGSVALPLVLGVVACVRGGAAVRGCGALVLALIAYQAWVGGDPWPYWRMAAPLVPLLFTVALVGMRRLSPRRSLAALMLVVALAIGNARFVGEGIVAGAPYGVELAQQSIDAAITLDPLLAPDATVAVIIGGTLPFFLDRPAIDLLGKNDPEIARLPPDLSGAVTGVGVRSLPGHNKYDLERSIARRLPTFVERFVWGRDDLRALAAAQYRVVSYPGVMLLHLRAGSPLVHWERIRPPAILR